MHVPAELLSRYAVRSESAADEWSTSYRATDANSGHPVRITVLSPEASGDEQVRAGFWRSLKLWRPLRHPYLLGVHGAGLADGRLWVATDDPGDLTLAAVATGSAATDVPRVLRLMADVAEVLDLIHSQGLLHLDLRPSCIWLSQTATRQHARLGGLAVGALTGAVGRLTTTGRLPATLSYVAPEQLRGEATGPATDQYSLACILVECLTGRPPHGNGHPLALIRSHLEAEPPSVSESVPGATARWDVAIRRALAKAPAERHAQCGAFMAELVPAKSFDSDPSDGADDGPALVVVGGPAAGLRLPLSAGDHLIGRGGGSDLVVPDPFLSREHVRLTVMGEHVGITDAGSTNGTVVGGRPVTSDRSLGPDEVFEAGASAFCVRRPVADGATPMAPNPGAADADQLLRLQPAERERLRRLATGRDLVEVRVGFTASTSSAERRCEPIVVDLAGGVVGVRGGATVRASMARWLLVQLAATHAPERLVLAGALRPTGEDVWAWVGTIPHAHTDNAEPFPGSRVGTDRMTTGVLVSRLVDVVAERRSRTRDVVAGVPVPFLPRIVVLADSGLVSADDVDVLARGHDVQVHPVWFGGANETPPSSVRTLVEIDRESGDVVVRRLDSAAVTATGTADGLSPDLARRAARDLAF